MGNKYHAKRTFSLLCNRTFSSRAEAIRGEELRLLEMAGEITDLEYQKRFTLSYKPKVSLCIDFRYIDTDGREILEDIKGIGETREFRVKRLWFREKFGKDIVIIKSWNVRISSWIVGMSRT